MKTRLFSLSASLALALWGGTLTSPLSAAPDQTPAMMYPVSEVWYHGLNDIKVGIADTSVLFRLGSPRYQPTEDVWIYHRYTADLEEACRFDCHNLLLTFSEGRISSIKLINDRAVDALTALGKKKGSVKLPATVYLTST